MLNIVHPIGHVTKDPVLKTGNQTKTKYLRLNLAADSGYGESKKTVFYQVTFFGNEAERIIKAKIKKGSFIELVGSIEEVITFQPDSSEEIMAMIRVKPYNWGFVSSPKRDGDAAGAQDVPTVENTVLPDPTDFIEIECGVDEDLPV